MSSLPDDRRFAAMPFEEEHIPRLTFIVQSFHTHVKRLVRLVLEVFPNSRCLGFARLQKQKDANKLAFFTGVEADAALEVFNLLWSVKRSLRRVYPVDVVDKDLKTAIQRLPAFKDIAAAESKVYMTAHPTELEADCRAALQSLNINVCDLVSAAAL